MNISDLKNTAKYVFFPKETQVKFVNLKTSDWFLGTPTFVHSCWNTPLQNFGQHNIILLYITIPHISNYIQTHSCHNKWSEKMKKRHCFTTKANWGRCSKETKDNSARRSEIKCLSKTRDKNKDQIANYFF